MGRGNKMKKGEVCGELLGEDKTGWGALDKGASGTIDFGDEEYSKK